MIERTCGRVLAVCWVILCGLQFACVSTSQRFAGADVSMLPEIEQAGGVFRANGQQRDALEILRDHGCSLFRVRLFVNPDPDFNKTAGATQDLKTVIALARRIRAAKGELLLNIHYSDTWADPAHQNKPKAWASLDFNALEARVYSYTSEVLLELKKENLLPAMVQVGNEITGGMLWPDGKVADLPKERERDQWALFARLVNAGARAVREASTPEHPIQIAIHIHGGGRPGLPQWFFRRFDQHPVDYDIIALSFYPQWGDSFEALKKNISELENGKDVLLAEVSYPWKPIDGVKDASLMLWPMTPRGQAQFVEALNDAVRTSPDRRLVGYIWWYPEAIPVPDSKLYLWKGGGEALFDQDGNVLPAAKTMAELHR